MTTFVYVCLFTINVEVQNYTVILSILLKLPIITYLPYINHQ